ncbi:IclR family transcriptional regulator [Microbacterium sp. SORGH_AS_0862]|uniref:IclR family transcriptional regulator n=1 Tax=Microbacterium sp. SORGH_AS_0862 TaxID=3041789 RepID=UPI00278CE0CC|nr:IclR family transcriptional regulator [Microbacterium sp. SORGH_AS_0862]MDQ1205280.1 DNA-binding IclR family transcriptional regulator [Microbacterium sp. SORGH_AS_0862]
MTEETRAGGTAGLTGITRALRVLSHLADAPAGLPMKAIHSELGIPFATVHRLLAALESEGWVVRSPTTKRYRLGPEAVRLGRSHGRTETIVAPPDALRVASVATGETVFLTRMYDTRVICISLVEGRHPLRLFVRAGQEMPLHAAASARTILAYQDPMFVEHLLTAAPRDAFTPGTIREVNRVIDHLAKVRGFGFDVCDNELDDDVWAVAAPVYEADGRVDVAVTIAAAAARMDSAESRVKAAQSVIAAGRALSLANGYIAADDQDLTAERLMTQMGELR